MAVTELDVTTSVDSTLDDAQQEGKTVFEVLANDARERSFSELRTTALGCAANAGLIFVYHPRWSWLAWAFVAASMYGVWGLADRVASRAGADAESRVGAHLVRIVTVGVGSGAAMWAAMLLMRALLGPGLRH